MRLIVEALIQSFSGIMNVFVVVFLIWYIIFSFIYFIYFNKKYKIYTFIQ